MSRDMLRRIPRLLDPVQTQLPLNPPSGQQGLGLDVTPNKPGLKRRQRVSDLALVALQKIQKL